MRDIGKRGIVVKIDSDFIVLIAKRASGKVTDEIFVDGMDR